MRRLAGILTIVLVVAPASAGDEGVELQPAVTGRGGVSIECPLGWEVRTESPGVAIACVSPSEGEGDFLENVIVVVGRRGAAAGSKPYLDQALAGFAGEAKVVERSSLDTEAWSASLAVYRKTDPLKPRVVLAVAILEEELAYVLMSTAADDEAMKAYKDRFDATVRSFRAGQRREGSPD